MAVQLEHPREREQPLRPQRNQGARSPSRTANNALLLVAAGWLATRANRQVVPATPTGIRLGEAAGAIGRGLLAGAVGTLAITLVAALEQHIKNRGKAEEKAAAAPPDAHPVKTFLIKLHEPWLFAGDAVGKVIGIEPVDQAAKNRLGITAHWLYGTAWGAGFGVLSLAGIRGPLAMGAVLAGQLTAEFVAMPAAKLFPPAREWGSEAIVSSVIDHTAYAIAAGTAYGFLQQKG